MPLGPCWALSKHNINCTGNNLFTFVLIVRKCPKINWLTDVFLHYTSLSPGRLAVLLWHSACQMSTDSSNTKMQLLLCWCCSKSDKFRTHHKNNKIVRLPARIWLASSFDWLAAWQPGWQIIISQTVSQNF